MVEKEVMDLIQIFSLVATATGVCFAATYYVITIKNTEKIRKRDLVFQKLNVNTIQWYRIFTDVAKMVDWETLEELYKKYSRWVNPEAYSKMIFVFYHYNCLGILVKDGVVEREEVFQLYNPSSIINIYDKFRPYIEQGSETEIHLSGFKFLYGEAKRMFPTAGSGQGPPKSLEDELERYRKRGVV